MDMGAVRAITHGQGSVRIFGIEIVDKFNAVKQKAYAFDFSAKTVKETVYAQIILKRFSLSALSAIIPSAMAQTIRLVVSVALKYTALIFILLFPPDILFYPNLYYPIYDQHLYFDK
jgi:hypothetical protein